MESKWKLGSKRVARPGHLEGATSFPSPLYPGRDRGQCGAQCSGSPETYFLPIPEQEQSPQHTQMFLMQEEILAEGTSCQERAAARVVLLRNNFNCLISPL